MLHTEVYYPEDFQEKFFLMMSPDCIKCENITLDLDATCSYAKNHQNSSMCFTSLYCWIIQVYQMPKMLLGLCEHRSILGYMWIWISWIHNHYDETTLHLYLFQVFFEAKIFQVKMKMLELCEWMQMKKFLLHRISKLNRRLSCSITFCLSSSYIECITLSKNSKL